MVLTEVIAAVQKCILVLSVFVFFIVVLVLCDLYRKRHIFKFARNYKGYKFYPIIGNGYHTIGKDLLTVVENVKKEYGLPCNIWNGHDCHYITADASEVKVILNNPHTFNKGVIYNSIRIAFENTLLLEKFDIWKRNRKIFSRSFSQPILNGFIDVFYGKACQLVEILKHTQSEDKCDIFSRLSLDNFCANVMGLDLDLLNNKHSKLVKILDRIQFVVGKRAFTYYFIPHYLFGLTAAGQTALKDFKAVRKFIYNIIHQKKQAFQENKDFREDSKKLPLMDMMLEAEGTMFTDEEIFREIFLFSLAATDTSGMTLAYIFVLLGMNPEVQKKIFEEVIQTVGLERPICHNDVPNFKYTERAIFEAMRLLPVTPCVERYAEADVDLGSKIIPAGTNIMISIFNLHRSESYWKNPLEYNPDRFLPEEVAQRDPYAFIPFSGGARNCIGMKYALMMIKTTVAHVIRNYEVRSKYKSVEDMKFVSFVTMKNLHELDCTFTPRNNNNNI